MPHAHWKNEIMQEYSRVNVQNQREQKLRDRYNTLEIPEFILLSDQELMAVTDHWLASARRNDAARDNMQVFRTLIRESFDEALTLHRILIARALVYSIPFKNNNYNSRQMEGFVYHYKRMPEKGVDIVAVDFHSRSPMYVSDHISYIKSELGLNFERTPEFLT